MPSDEELWALLHSGDDLRFAEPPDYPGAIAIYRHVVALAPGWAQVHICLSHALQWAGDLPQALIEAQKAIELDPEEPHKWGQAGIVLSELGEWDRSIEALEKAIALRPHYSEADLRLYLAEAYEGAGRREDAEEQWRIVLTMEPGYPSDDEPMKEARRRLKGRPRRLLKKR